MHLLSSIFTSTSILFLIFGILDSLPPFNLPPYLFLVLKLLRILSFHLFLYCLSYSFSSPILFSLLLFFLLFSPLSSTVLFSLLLFLLLFSPLSSTILFSLSSLFLLLFSLFSLSRSIIWNPIISSQELCSQKYVR